MKAILSILLQVVLASGILYGYYHFFLRNKQFHQYNRFYLLAAAVVSLLIPFLQIPVYLSTSGPEPSVVLQTLQSISISGFENEATDGLAVQAPVSSFDWSAFAYIVYACVGFILLMRIIISLRKIILIKRAHRFERLDGIQFIPCNEPGTPYSFFRWLFWNQKLSLGTEEGDQIFRHEVFHIQQKHSWDVIYFELLTTICWINPFFHLMKKETRAIHEFLADQFAVDENQKWAYAELLLMQALRTNQSLANPFFHNQIKRRIAMITNPQRTSHRYLRKLLVLPVAALVLTLFAFRFKELRNDHVVLPIDEQLTLVIDAGHGGTDPGVQSPDNKYNEAAISLSIARKVQSLAAAYNIKVVMTRDNDEFPGGANNKEDGLRNRVSISEKSSADAFVAVHINVAGTSTQYQDKHSGFEAYVTAKKTSKEDEQLAAAILGQTSSLYKTDKIIQRRNANGIYVLDANSAPSVILECGYINNSKDLAFITDEANQEKIAKSILQGLIAFKTNAPTVINIRVPVDTVPKITNSIKIKEVPVEVAKDSAILGISYPSKQPLYVIDGVVSTATATNQLANVNPSSIKTINVLKDKSAVEKYGERAKNGVIEVFTVVPSKTIEEVKVTGTGVQEVVVEGKPLQKVNVQGTQVEKVVVENKKPNDLNEVVVVGYGTQIKGVEGPIFESLEADPAFNGGASAWSKFLERNLNANVAVNNYAPAGSYTVRIKFIIDKDGNISNFKPLTNHGYGMEEEVIRVLKSGGSWTPGIQNGKKVNAWRVQPVTFVVDRQKKIT